MTEKTGSKNQLIIAIIGGLFLIGAAIISSPHWFKYFFPELSVEPIELPIQEIKIVSNKTDNKKADSEKKELGTENLIINNVELCPVNSKLPNYLLVEIKNKGTKVLKGVNLNINLGRASFTGIELFGDNIISVDTTKRNDIYVTYTELKENESKTIYCLLTQPVFNSIKVKGENLDSTITYTYNSFVKNGKLESINLNGFYIFLQFLAAFVLFIFSLFFISMVYRFLNKTKIIDWN